MPLQKAEQGSPIKPHNRGKKLCKAAVLAKPGFRMGSFPVSYGILPTMPGTSSSRGEGKVAQTYHLEKHHMDNLPAGMPDINLKQQSRDNKDLAVALAEQQRSRRDLTNQVLRVDRQRLYQLPRSQVKSQFINGPSFRDRFLHEHEQHKITQNLLAEEQRQRQLLQEELLREKEQNHTLKIQFQEEQMQRQSSDKWLSNHLVRNQNLKIRLYEARHQRQTLRGQLTHQKIQMKTELVEEKEQRQGLEQSLMMANKQKVEVELKLEHLQEVKAALERERDLQNDRINSARLKLQRLPDVQHELQVAKEAEKKAQDERRELLSMGAIAKGNCAEVFDFVQRCQSYSAVALSDVIKSNRAFCQASKYDLANGHNNNVSQLYRLLNEEVAELIEELKKPTIDKRRIASEADDVLSYALQFIWEFDLRNHLDAGCGNGASGSRGILLLLRENFLQLQSRVAETIHASMDGESVLADLGALPLVASRMADSVRAINEDFNKTKLSKKERQRQLAESVAEVVWAVAELTVFFLVDMTKKAICTGKYPPTKKKYHNNRSRA